MAMVLCTLFTTCTRERADELPEYRTATEVSLEWNRLMLDLERHTPGYRPPVSARAFAYVGMAAYEAALPALDDYLPLDRYFPGYEKPANRPPQEAYCLSAGLNAAYARILRRFFPEAPRKWLDRIDRIEADWQQKIERQSRDKSSEASIAYGQEVAENVWRWSATDAEGHDAFLFNYDKNYVPPGCAGCWQPDERHPMPALLPHWGKVRSFVVSPAEVPVNRPAAFEENAGSAFYTEAMEVFSVSQPISRENRWIAELWSDDLTGLTVTPVGRWISITNQALDQEHPPFPVVVETYLKVAVALCDASIIVWASKYHFNVERPQSFIRRNIKADWEALHENPSFPAYPSGHSTFGAAAAEVLEVQLGRQFTLTDRTHENRQEFVGTPRTYQSFGEMARENAASRVLIGVHYRMDCEEGLRIGKIAGQKVAAWPLRRIEAAVRQ